MEKRELGRTGIQLPLLVFGGNVLGWTVNEKEAFYLLDSLVDQGFNTIDTADIYSYWGPGNKGGESELIIGKWLRTQKSRENIFIHTKGGAPDAPGEFANANLSEKYLIKAVEASLKRLDTEYIDLYYTHYDDNQTPPEETLGALQKLIKQGKIRLIGASNISPKRLELFLKTSQENNLPKYSCLQTLYNLYDRQEYEKNYQKFCIEHEIGVLSYFSLAQGFLSGKYRSLDDLSTNSSRGTDIAKYLNPRGINILNTLDQIANAYKVKPSQIAIKWLLEQPGITAPVVSATNLNQLQEILNAVQLRIDKDSIELLNSVSAE
ncbi:aldo/keto reductase [Acinetobacter baumannii]